MSLFFALLLCAVAPVGPSPTPPPARQSLANAWWTGPLLAPSAGTLPRGHLLVEPYLFDVIQYGAFDAHGSLQPATHANTYGSLTYVIYGLTDRFNVGVIPVFSYSAPAGGPNSSGVGVGDWAILAQYGLTKFREGHSMPTTAIAVQETFPTGKYDNLSRAADGQGGGAYSTKLSLYSQTYFWMGNGRILRTRLNLSDTFSGAAAIHGASVYGTSSGFVGTAHPGNTLNLDGAFEYSITRNWVFASDVVYNYAASTRVTSASGLSVESGDSHNVGVAPALEYNWNGNVGIIAGFRWFPGGINTAASLTPVIAINYVH